MNTFGIFSIVLLLADHEADRRAPALIWALVVGLILAGVYSVKGLRRMKAETDAKINSIIREEEQEEWVQEHNNKTGM